MVSMRTPAAVSVMSEDPPSRGTLLAAPAGDEPAKRGDASACWRGIRIREAARTIPRVTRHGAGLVRRHFGIAAHRRESRACARPSKLPGIRYSETAGATASDQEHLDRT